MKKIKVQLTAKMARDLEKLVQSGLFGISIEDAAERLLAERLRQVRLEVARSPGDFRCL